MPDHKAITTNLATAGAKMFCMDPDVKDLTFEQLNALHLCKHEILCAIYRVYMHVEPVVADKLIKKYLVAAIGKK